MRGMANMTEYMNERGTRWKVIKVPCYSPLWGIKRFYKNRTEGEWLLSFRCESSLQLAQTKLDELAKKRGWKKNETPPIKTNELFIITPESQAKDNQIAVK